MSTTEEQPEIAIPRLPERPADPVRPVVVRPQLGPVPGLDRSGSPMAGTFGPGAFRMGAMPFVARPAPPPPRRSKGWAVLLVLVVLAGGGGAGWYLTHRPPPEAEETVPLGITTVAATTAPSTTAAPSSSVAPSTTVPFVLPSSIAPLPANTTPPSSTDPTLPPGSPQISLAGATFSLPGAPETKTFKKKIGGVTYRGQVWFTQAEGTYIEACVLQISKAMDYAMAQDFFTGLVQSIADDGHGNVLGSWIANGDGTASRITSIKVEAGYWFVNTYARDKVVVYLLSTAPTNNPPQVFQAVVHTFTIQ